MTDLFEPVKEGETPKPRVEKFDPAPLANLVRPRSYMRRLPDGTPETWDDTVNRMLYSEHLGLRLLGRFTDDEITLIDRMLREKKAFGSARWNWIGGTKWLENPVNDSGSYNCTNLEIIDWKSFSRLMDMAMQGSGTGAVVETDIINQLPAIKNKINVEVINQPGDYPVSQRKEKTLTWTMGNTITILVGDSRLGWCEAYEKVLSVSSDEKFNGEVGIIVDIGGVRPAGEDLKGFGGVSNPISLGSFFNRIVDILDGAVGRKLNSLEVCLIINEAASTIVAGNIRRSANIQQGSYGDEVFTNAKANLWQQDDNGNWRIDPKRDALRMANLTRVYHHKPSLEECIEAVTTQVNSGEGAIQWAGEAVARANADILDTSEKRLEFLGRYSIDHPLAEGYIKSLMPTEELNHPESARILYHRMHRYGINPCFRGDMRLLTVDGYKTFEELNDSKINIVNASGQISQSAVWCTGEREIVELILTNRKSLFCTPDHRWMTEVGEREAKDCKGLKLKPFLKVPEHDPLDIRLGFTQGDGQLTRLKAPGFLGVEVNIGKDDHDILEYYPEYEWHGPRRIYVYNLRETLLAEGFHPEPLPTRTLPLKYTNWQLHKKAGFLNGLYSANGSVIESCGRITLKTTSRQLVDEVIDALKEFGIEGYFTTNKPTRVMFENGEYECKESYDINIHQYDSRLKFFNLINFSIQYKTEKLRKSLSEHPPSVRAIKSAGIAKVYDFTEPLTRWGVVEGFVAHNCGEILGSNFHCNLASIHLNNLDPWDLQEQENAFTASALQGAAFFHTKFIDERNQFSRDIDPIVGVSITGPFIFFTKLLGSDYVYWWESGRDRQFDSISPDGEHLARRACALLGLNYGDYKVGSLYHDIEKSYYQFWKDIVHKVVWDYCDRHGLKRPNRCTTVKPEGSMQLLTGVDCNGAHPPSFGWHFIRRITFRKDDPIAIAAIDYGYSVVPSQSDKDEDGNLLNDPFDKRVTEWLVEVPVQNQLIHLYPELENINPKKFSAVSHFDFWLNIQKHYTTHNTSVTINLEHSEIVPLATEIYNAIKNDEGYISAALLAKYDSPFPRLPYETISKETYDRLSAERARRCKDSNFDRLLNNYLIYSGEGGPQDSACDGGFCSLK
jgi:ribonucleotide reductase class II